jgi:hypothetical protein
LPSLVPEGLGIILSCELRANSFEQKARSLWLVAQGYY